MWWRVPKSLLTVRDLERQHYYQIGCPGDLLLLQDMNHGQFSRLGSSVDGVVCEMCSTAGEESNFLPKSDAESIQTTIGGLESNTATVPVG
jgi:hypothetical protein